MNARKVYSDRVAELETKKTNMEKTDSLLNLEKDELDSKRDKIVLLGIPATIAICVLSIAVVSILKLNPMFYNAIAALTGVSLISLSVKELLIGLKINKIINDIESNTINLEKNELDIVHAKDLLKSFDKYKGLCNEEINNKDNNITHINSFINNLTHNKNKTRSLKYNKTNIIKK